MRALGKLGLVLALVVAGCPAMIGVDEETVREVAADEGYVDVRIEMNGVFGCGEDDYRGTRFRAHRAMPDGSVRTVTAIMCCGAFKACTIRHR